MQKWANDDLQLLAEYARTQPIYPQTSMKVRQHMSINDQVKRLLAELLTDRWMLYKEQGSSIYVRHVLAPRQNVLYQVMLGGNGSDGIYELAFKGKKVHVTQRIIDGTPVLCISSRGNYDLARFGRDRKTVCRFDYKDPEEFKRVMLSTSVITADDFDTYSNPPPEVRQYLDKILPRVHFF